MLKIRLQRVGKKNQASFRIVLAEKQRAVTKKVVERLGYYDPRLKTFGIKDPERLKYWIAKQVEISPTVNNLLVSKGLLEGKKVQAWRPKKKKEETKQAVGATTEAKSESSLAAPTEISNDKAQMPNQTQPPNA